VKPMKPVEPTKGDYTTLFGPDDIPDPELEDDIFQREQDEKPMPEINDELFEILQQLSFEERYMVYNKLTDDEIRKIKVARTREYRKATQKFIMNNKEIILSEQLKLYSPKYYTILQHLKDNPRMNQLMYSRYVDVPQGLLMFKLILHIHGYSEFKFVKKEGEYVLDMTDEELNMPSFAVYSGQVEATPREYIRKIFNGDFDGLPDKITERLKTRDNRHGENIQLFMISESGAEGLDLKNIRKVHILEPHWNAALLDQVVGRAVRINSHIGLPQRERNVEAYIYLMEMTETQKANIHMEAEHETTDEKLYKITQRKRRINEAIFKTLKETAIDCEFHSETHQDEDLTCFTISNPKYEQPMYEIDYNEQQDAKTERLNVQAVKQRYLKTTYKGEDYYYKEDKSDLVVYQKKNDRMEPTTKLKKIIKNNQIKIVVPKT
jgi:hypothetical protein